MLSCAASPPHKEDAEVGGEERPSGMRREGAAATICPLGWPRLGFCPGSPSQSWRLAVEVIYPSCHLLPCCPLLGFTKQSSLNQGTSCCPASTGASPAPILGAEARGPAHFRIEMVPRGLGVQRRDWRFSVNLHSRGLRALGKGRCQV